MIPRFIAAVLSAATLYSPALLAETPVFGVLLNSPDTPYWNTIGLGLRDGVESQQAEYYVQALQNDETENAPLDLCNSMLDRKPNVLLVVTSTASLLSTCFEKAAHLNIPVIGIGDELLAENINISSAILADNTESANLTAEFISNTLGTSADGLVFVSNNNKDQLAIDALTEQLQLSAPALSVIEANKEDVANFAPGMRAIIAADNDSAISMLERMQNNTDNAGDVLVISLDEQADYAAMLEAGKIHAVVTTLPYLFGKTAVEQATLAMNTNNSDGAIYIKPVLLTQQKLQEGNDPALDYLK